MSKFTTFSTFSKHNIKSLSGKLDVQQRFNHSITSYISVHGDMKQISIGRICI